MNGTVLDAKWIGQLSVVVQIAPRVRAPSPLGPLVPFPVRYLLTPFEVFVLVLIVIISVALVVHEVGHIIAARRCHVPASELSLGLGPVLVSFQVRGLRFSLRAIPLGSFVRLDGTALSARPVAQQLLVHLGGVILNLIVGLATFGTIFSWINLLIAVGNMLPLYQHDGWKCGVVIVRSLLQRKSQPIEWAFTFSGGFVSLVAVVAVLRALL